MAVVPKPPDFDAVAWNSRLKEAIPKRPDGTPIVVWDQLPPFIKWTRVLRDRVEELRVGVFGAEGVKADVDSLRGMTDKRLDAHDQRLDALEGQSPPFPA